MTGAVPDLPRHDDRARPGAIAVTPTDFTVPAGRNAGAADHDRRLGPDGGRSTAGTILLDAAAPAATDVHLPVAFGIHQGVVTLAASCASTDLGGRRVDRLHGRPCRTPPAGPPLRPRPARRTARPANLAVGGFGAAGRSRRERLHGDRHAAAVDGAAHHRRSSPAGHAFVDLRARGVQPLTGIGDETMVNVATGLAIRVRRDRVPHAGDRLERLRGDRRRRQRGPDASGPQDVPDPARPNNVLAPYWTDLNPALGGRVYVGRVKSRRPGTSSSNGGASAS